MPGRRRPVAPPDTTLQQHASQAFPGGLSGQSYVPSPSTEPIIGGSPADDRSVKWHRDVSVGTDLQQYYYLRRMPVRESVRVFNADCYVREGSEWVWDYERTKTSYRPRIRFLVPPPSYNVIQIYYAYKDDAEFSVQGDRHVFPIVAWKDFNQGAWLDQGVDPDIPPFLRTMPLGKVLDFDGTPLGPERQFPYLLDRYHWSTNPYLRGLNNDVYRGPQNVAGLSPYYGANIAGTYRWKSAPPISPRSSASLQVGWDGPDATGTDGFEPSLRLTGASFALHEATYVKFSGYYRLLDPGLGRWGTEMSLIYPLSIAIREADGHPDSYALDWDFGWLGCWVNAYNDDYSGPDDPVDMVFSSYVGVGGTFGGDTMDYEWRNARTNIPGDYYFEIFHDIENDSQSFLLRTPADEYAVTQRNPGFWAPLKRIRDPGSNVYGDVDYYNLVGKFDSADSQVRAGVYSDLTGTSSVMHYDDLRIETDAPWYFSRAQVY